MRISDWSSDVCSSDLAPIEFRWKDSRNMATAISANKAELLAIADAVAREKLIDRDIVIEAMEDAIQRAARSRYGAENDIRAKIDPKSGEIGRASCRERVCQYV